MGILDNASFQVQCPQCGKEMTFAIADFSKSIVCSDCDCQFSFETNELNTELAQTEQLLTKLFGKNETH